MDYAQMSTDDLLEKANVPILQGSHVQYTSGRHGESYVNLRVLGIPENKPILREMSLRLLEKMIGKTNAIAHGRGL